MATSFRHRLTAAKNTILEARTREAIEVEKSLHFDQHIAINSAQAVMLAEVGMLTAAERDAIVAALEEISAAGPAELNPAGDEEDLFSVVEGALIRRCGVEVAGKLHTGRSRNDYYMAVARLAVKQETELLIAEIAALIDQLLVAADNYAGQIFPGYTHNSQQAQPVSLGHFFLAHADAFQRDLDRHTAALARVDLSPLGAAALGGTDFPLDRGRVAELLGFAGVVENTQDAAGIRDFQLETAGNTLTLMLNANRLVEALILYNTAEFGLISVDDSLMGVSSIMPQKRNPVALEYVEVATSQALAGLVSAAMTLKSTTIGMSEEAISIDDTIVKTSAEARYAVGVLRSIVAGVRVNEARVDEVLRAGFFTVTQLADFLVAAGEMPFRVAHTVVALAVTELTSAGLDLSTAAGRAQLISALRIHAAAETGTDIAASDDELEHTLDPAAIVLARTLPGGPGEIEVRRMVAARTQAA